MEINLHLFGYHWCCVLSSDAVPHGFSSMYYNEKGELVKDMVRLLSVIFVPIPLSIIFLNSSFMNVLSFCSFSMDL